MGKHPARPRRIRWKSSRPPRIHQLPRARPPFGAPLDGYDPPADDDRRAKAAALASFLRGLASTDKPQVGHFTDDPRVLDFLAGTEHPRLAALGHQLP